MLTKSSPKPPRTVYFAQQNPRLTTCLKANLNSLSFNQDNLKSPVSIKKTFPTFAKLKVATHSVYLVPFGFNLDITLVEESAIDVDYGKTQIKANNQEVVFIKRNLYLEGYPPQYAIIDENALTATLETPSGNETFKKIYLYPTNVDPRSEAPIYLCPLKNLDDGYYCVRPSYMQEALLIEPGSEIRFKDINRNLYYNALLDRLCDIDHEDYYREEYSEMFSDETNTESDLDDGWPY